MPPFVLALLTLLAAPAVKSVAPTAGQINWLGVAGTMLGIIISVGVIVKGIKTAVKKMMTEVADDCIAAFKTETIVPLEREYYELKGELRSLTR